MDWRVGGLYSLAAEGGAFQVAKVLVVEPKGIHVRLYKNRFDARPTVINEAQLSLGSIYDKSGELGVGHLALRYELFCSWQPEWIAQSQVKPDELDGYEIWKGGAGYW